LLEKYINKVSYCKLTDRASASVSLNILAGAGDVVDFAKFFLISSLITVQNLAAVSHAMPCGAYIEDCCEEDCMGLSPELQPLRGITGTDPVYDRK